MLGNVIKFSTQKYNNSLWLHVAKTKGSLKRLAYRGLGYLGYLKVASFIFIKQDIDGKQGFLYTSKPQVLVITRE